MLLRIYWIKQIARRKQQPQRWKNDVNLLRAMLHCVRSDPIRSDPIRSVWENHKDLNNEVQVSMQTWKNKKVLDNTNNPLNPKIKIWILICCSYLFPAEVAGRSW